MSANTTLMQQIWDFPDLILNSRFAEAIAKGVAQYPIKRNLRFAARMDIETMFDSIAMHTGWKAHRISSGRVILDGDGLFVTGWGSRKADYCSCSFDIWASSPSQAETIRNTLLGLVGDKKITEPMFSIDWNFLTSRGELQDASIEEMADDVILDSAYPYIVGGVHHFIQSFLNATETVLVLQGSPGTGKTRLIRAILGELSRKKQGETQALYTGDKKTLESDEIFVKFITGWHDVFVVEDADHILKPREQGNEHLHRFLTIADGVVRSQGRKIIFSTNLPNIGDLDDALIRPGRCFSRMGIRELSLNEAIVLTKDLCSQYHLAKIENIQQQIIDLDKKSYSLAEIYQLVRRADQYPLVVG